MEIDTIIFTQSALIAFGLVFLGGIVTSIGPCNITVHRLVLDERPDLQRSYDIQRAPMLLLDANGQVIWREWGVASNPNVFDLTKVEAQIRAWNQEGS